MADSLSTLYACADNVNHYFRALGGSNQYLGFMNWHIPAFTLLVVKGKAGSKLLPQAAWRNTEKLQKEILVKLNLMPLNNPSLDDFITRTSDMVKRFKTKEEEIQWLDFCSQIHRMKL